MKLRVVLALLCLLGPASCSRQGVEKRAARIQYNASLDDYQANRWEAAAKGFLAARDQAGIDPELRYRAAFNLGMSYAGQADGMTQDKPQDAIDLLHQSATWFRDAIRIQPDGDDARVNLEIVLRRAQLLADQLNKSQNTLEARLQRVIEDQRSLLDSVRKLMDKIATASPNAAAAPLGYASDFENLATFERTLLSDAGTVAQLAGDELEGLKNQDDDKRSDQDKMRLYQLTNLDQHLQSARAAMADSRGLLRRLQGGKAQRRASAALFELKRAAEQLLDPVTVLKSIRADQTMLLYHTQALIEIGKGSISLAGGEPVKPPAWLDADNLRDRQTDIHDRTAEILARFQAAGQNPTPEPNADPHQARTLAEAAEAVPLLITATDEMNGAAGQFDGQLAAAAEHEIAATSALIQAIELFSDIRGLIELAYADQNRIVTLLTPPEPGAAPAPETEKLSEADRAALIRDATGHNRQRMERLAGLIADEQAALANNAPPAPDPKAAQDPDDPNAKAAAEHQAKLQLYQQAETLRSAVAAALERLDADLAERRPAEPPLTPATEARASLEELRRLFFSVVEHLEELHRDQTKTHDDTATAHDAPDDAQRNKLLGPIADFQARHAAMGQAIAKALAEQADAAAAQPAAGAPGQPGGQPAQADPEAADKLAKAAEEVDQATTDMTSAAALVKDALDPNVSHDLQPILDKQSSALDHLAAALAILKPPEQQPDQKQQQKQKQESQDQVSQQQAQRRLQKIRDDEAKRKRDRQQMSKPEPVEKDW